MARALVLLLAVAVSACAVEPPAAVAPTDAGADAALTFAADAAAKADGPADAAPPDAAAPLDAPDAMDVDGLDGPSPPDVALDASGPDAAAPDAPDAAAPDAPDAASPDAPDAEAPDIAAEVAAVDGGAPDAAPDAGDAADTAVLDAAAADASDAADAQTLDTTPKDAAVADAAPDVAAPAECLEDAACDDGNACTADACVKESCQHVPATAGTACGDATVATQFQCNGADLTKRTAVAGCNGAAAACSTATPAWSAWQKVKTCVSLKACQVAADGTSGVCAAGCTPNTTCCAADGSVQPKQTKCGTIAWDSEDKCSGPEKGGQILTRSAYSGCIGTSASCSSADANLAWTDWAVEKTCKATEVCEFSFGYASCVSAVKCTPGVSKCCTGEGAYAAKGTQCSTYAGDWQYQCSGTGKGNVVQERKGYDGCSGTSTACSYSDADTFWGPWATYKQCKATETCEVSSSGSYGSCVNAVACTPNGTCCTADGEFAAKGGKCGTFPTKTEQKCSGTGKGVAILQREAFASCTGTSTGCSYTTADLWWSEWATDETCASSQYCKQSSPTYAYCTTTPP